MESLEEFNLELKKGEEYLKGMISDDVPVVHCDNMKMILDNLNTIVRDLAASCVYVDGFYDWHKKQGYVSLKKEDMQDYIESIKTDNNKESLTRPKSSIKKGDKVRFDTGNYSGLTGVVSKIDWNSKDKRAIYETLHEVDLSNGTKGFIEKSEHWVFI
jgi:hypothetical protein